MGTVINILQARGNTADFVSRLSRAHGPQLLRYLERMLGRKDVAEDVAQEAYLKLYRLSRPNEVNSPAPCCSTWRPSSPSTGSSRPRWKPRPRTPKRR